MYKDEQTFETAISNGVQRYALKDSAMTEIIECIRSVAAGHAYITPSLSRFLMKSARTSTP